MMVNNSTKNLQEKNLLDTVKVLLLVMLSINIIIFSVLYFFNQQQFLTDNKLVSYHLTTESHALKLNNEILQSKQILLSAVDIEHLTEKHFELFSQLSYVIKTRILLINKGQAEFNDAAFSRSIKRLNLHADNIINHIKNVTLATQWQSSVLMPKLSSLSISVEQIQALHKNAYYQLFAKSKLNKKSNFLLISALVFLATLAGVLTTRFSFINIRKAINKEHSARKELDKINSELEHKIAVRTKDLEDKNVELERYLNQYKLTLDQLVQSEKMASLGRLVAGVAHEINTPIGVSVSAISYLEKQLKQLSKLYQSNNLTEDDFSEFLSKFEESCSMIQLNLSRTAQLVKSFKEVSVDQSRNENRKINLKRYLEDIHTSLSPEFKKNNHQFMIHCEDDIVIYTDPGALSQVISNLIMNSIIHGFDTIDNGQITIKASVRDTIVEFIYQDNGKGISADIADKVFDPFFTTKRDNGGSGLGMSIVYNTIIQSLGGTIKLNLENTVKGVCFYIFLPLIISDSKQHQGLSISTGDDNTTPVV